MSESISEELFLVAIDSALIILAFVASEQQPVIENNNLLTVLLDGMVFSQESGH